MASIPTMPPPKINFSRFGYIGNIELISGDSTKTVPNYFNAHPDKYFDLITVDGDHRIKGAKKDLKNIKDIRNRERNKTTRDD